MSEPKSFDVVVIGAGPGGYAAAFYAADHGKKVALIEKDATLGGVCLNRGCIPSKALLHVAKLIDEAEEAGDFGVSFEKPKVDLDKLRSKKDEIIARLEKGINALAKARGVSVIKGTASFKEQQLLEVKGKSASIDVAFEHAIIAVGSSPIVPASLAVDSPRVMDSTGALELKDIPEKFLLVGGGVIGLELGSVYATLGSKVTVVEALPDLAAPVDRDLFRPLEKRLKKKFEEIHLNARVLSLKEAGDKIQAEYQKGEETLSGEFDRVLLCIGRSPNSKGLGLENAGIEVDERGFIKVDKASKTSNPKVYAIGDVVPGPMLAHKSSREGKIAVESLLGKKTIFDNVGIPSVIYTDPEVAWVGKTEIEAKAEGINYKMTKFPWVASGRALTSGRSEGMTKILFDPDSEQVLGVGITGINAGELIAEAGLALEMGCVATDLTDTIHAHPTLAETIMESAEVLHGMSTHVFTKK